MITECYDCGRTLRGCKPILKVRDNVKKWLGKLVCRSCANSSSNLYNTTGVKIKEN
jgi:hypothetical protein